MIRIKTFYHILSQFMRSTSQLLNWQGFAAMNLNNNNLWRPPVFSKDLLKPWRDKLIMYSNIFIKAMWKFNTGIRFEAYGYILTKIYCKALWIHFLHFLDKEWYLTHLKNLKNWKISKENKFVFYLNTVLKKRNVDVIVFIFFLSGWNGEVLTGTAIH